MSFNDYSTAREGTHGASCPTSPDGLLPILVVLAALGMASSPTPDRLGPGEIAIALGLVAAIGWTGPATLAAGLRPLGVMALAWLIAAPTLTGLWAGWRLDDLWRDLVGLGFLFLPLLVAHRLVAPSTPTALAIALVGVGAAFGLRFLWSSDVAPMGIPLGLGRDPETLLYLHTSPAVGFATLAGPLVAWRLLDRGRWAASLALGGGGALALLVLVVTHQRASVAAVALAAVAILTVERARRGALLALVLVAITAGPMLAGDAAWRAVEVLWEKSLAVGFNNHDAEIVAVLELVGRDAITLLFGVGWGGLITTPAVPGEAVSYVHAFPFYLLFKGGLAALVAGTVWVVCLWGHGARALARDPALTIAALAPLAVAAIAHTGFKTLEAGVLLCLLVALSTARTADQSGRIDEGRLIVNPRARSNAIVGRADSRP